MQSNYSIFRHAIDLAVVDDRLHHLAIFIPSMCVGGTEKAMLNLATDLSRRGHRVDMVLARAEGAYVDELPATVRIVNLDSSRVLTSLPALVNYLRTHSPEVMLSALTHANLVAVWARRLSGARTRLVVSERSTLSIAAPLANALLGHIFPVLARRFYPWADRVVAVSNGVAADLIERIGIPVEKVSVIDNPVITPEFDRKMHGSVKHPWFGVDGSPVVLATGRLTREKDYPTLLRAFKTVIQSSNARLVILGEGEERTSLEGLVRELYLQDVVSLPGYTKNPYPYMAQADVFVLSSQLEGLPAVLIEALACGTPVVSTDCPSGAREILNDGEYGVLVPVGDSDRLASAIAKALRNGHSHMPASALSRFELNHAVDSYIKELLPANDE